jgi:hypothetical protein
VDVPEKYRVASDFLETSDKPGVFGAAASLGGQEEPRQMPRQRREYPIYAVWGFSTEREAGYPELIAATPDPEIAAAVRRIVDLAGGPMDGGHWEKIEIDVRQVSRNGLSAFFDGGGKPILMDFLTRGEMVDLLDNKRVMSEMVEDREAVKNAQA